MPEQKSLISRLRRLFSTNVIVRNVGKRKLKVVDMSHYQGDGSPYSTKRVDRYGRIHSSRGMGINTYNQYNSFVQNKMELYSDYEAMDQDPILNSALDIYCEESTTKSDLGEVLVIKSEDEDIKAILHNLFYDVLNIDFNIAPWIRNLCKYGDFYLWLDIQDEFGVVNATPLSAYEVTREEGFDLDNPQQFRFIYEGGGGRGLLESFEVAHFRLIGDTNFLPYGTSVLEGARKLFKQLTLLIDAMMVHRVMRAPERRIFNVDVGNLPENEIDGFIQKLANETKKVPFIDERTGQYNLRYNMMNILEDLYIPTRGGEAGTKIETLPGLEYQAIPDIEFLQERLFAALKIPKPFLGYSEDTGGKAVLSSLDIRFARTIERIQRTVESELVKIAIIHLFSQGYKDSDLVNFKLELTSPSIIYEQEKIELMKNKADLAKSLQELNLLSNEYIYASVFQMSKTDAKYQQDEVIEDTKQKFRRAQIENEGNDPAMTNESYGTPHDLASLQKSGEQTEELNDEVGPQGGSPKGGWAGAGRPAKNLKYGTDDHPLGRDPLGNKAGSNIKAEGVSTKKQNATSVEVAERITRGMKKKVSKSDLFRPENNAHLISDSFDVDLESNGGLLDDRNLIKESFL